MSVREKVDLGTSLFAYLAAAIVAAFLLRGYLPRFRERLKPLASPHKENETHDR